MIPEEQSSLDIDWFFMSKNKIGFVASAGGRLPKSVSKSEDNIQLLSDFFRGLPKISNIEVNPHLEEVMVNRRVDEPYLSDFIFMAEKGLYAFDKTFLDNFDDDTYHLVVKPITDLNIADLPSYVIEVLSQTSNDEDVNDYFRSSLLP